MQRLRSTLRLAVLVGVAVAAEAAAQTHELDHLLCYRMRDPLTAEAKFDLLARLQPEFSRAGCWLMPDGDDGVHSQFCVPASKVVTDAAAHDPALGGPPLSADYACYRIECPEAHAPPDKIVEDQFGRRAVRFRAPVRLCVPARKEPLPCSPTGTAAAPQCGGECPDPAQRCRRDKRTGLCTCEPSECRGRPDAAGTCGGACPDPAQRCARGDDNRCVCAPRGCGVDPASLQCSGACPVPGEFCTTDAAGDCRCVPPQPTCARQDGECGGPCPTAGDVCVADTTGNCACQPPPPPTCGLDADGVCGGPCPPGRDCALVGGACACVPPPPQCGVDPLTGECGGPCPTAGDVCVADAAGNCACQPPPRTCGLETNGECSGTCPPGLDCLPRADGSCGCGRSCGLDPGSGRCGGECPAGSVCGLLPTNPNCQCIALP
jgi:hypothetical protein